MLLKTHIHYRENGIREKREIFDGPEGNYGQSEYLVGLENADSPNSDAFGSIDTMAGDFHNQMGEIADLSSGEGVWDASMHAPDNTNNLGTSEEFAFAGSEGSENSSADTVSFPSFTDVHDGNQEGLKVA